MPSGQPSPAGGAVSYDGVWVAMALNLVVLGMVTWTVLHNDMSFIRMVEGTAAGWLGLPSSAPPSHVTCAATPPKQTADHIEP